MQKESDFQQPALSESEVIAPRSDPSNNTISPAQIAQNVNLSDIFPFEFEANKSPFLLSNAAAMNKKLLLSCTLKPHRKWDNTPCFTCGDMLSEECNWIDIAMRGGVCDQTCQYVLSISEKVRRETLFDATYNNALNKLYYYPYDAKIIFDLAMTLINRATQKDVCQIKEAEYIEYTIKLAGFNYEDKVETYHQITSYTYPIQECSECYVLSIPLLSENNQEEIEFGKPETKNKTTTTPIYFTENQPIIQLKYFDNNGQGIKPEKAHEIDAEYDFRYLDKDTLVLQPKFLTKIDLKIALEISSGTIVQIASRLSLASKGINIKEGVIDAGYTEDITIMLQNETDKLFRIEHVEKIVQAIYLLLINISGLQSVNNRKQLGKSERKMQGFGSTG
ncbi:hypothetical protein G9A89_018382 [Geosiphon pyriformis]|nr:hypothetical protein G9A89_018382 [Geosiphon pyriformis]